jgi:hypothetical protein
MIEKYLHPQLLSSSEQTFEDLFIRCPRIQIEDDC